MRKDLHKTIGSLTDRTSYYHLLLLLASLPFDRFFSHVILISFALHMLIHLRKPAFDLRSIIILASVFFVTAISTLYTTNLPGAFNELTLHIPILIFPVLFCLAAIVLEEYRGKLLMGFAWVCAATVIYLYIDAFRLIKHYHLPYSAIFSAAFTNHNFSAPVDMHATFFSMQIAIALVYVISVLIKEKTQRWQLVICAGILTAGLVQLCSKSVLFALLLIVNLAVPIFFLQKKRMQYVAIATSFSIAILVVIFSVGTLHTRYITDLHTDLSPSSSGQMLDSRMARWGIVTDMIKQAPVFGHGAGTETAILHEQFFSNKFYSSFLKNLNAHNQYLSFLFKSGIWGLLIYLGTLCYGFNIAIKRKDLLFFTFMMLVALISLSENLLDVDKGVFFYAVFFSFFMFSASKNNNGHNLALP